MSVGIKEHQAGSVTVLELSRRLTMGSGSEALDEKLQSLIADGRLALLLDCSQVSTIDSRGIRVLVRGVTSIEKRGGKLKLLKVPRRVREVLDVTRLLTVIETFDDEHAALRSFTSIRQPRAEALPRGEERRRSPRVRLMTQVETLGPGASSLGRIQDISVGGLLTVSRDTFEPNSEVTVRFNLPPVPPGLSIEAQGVVAHVLPGVKMGIQFLLLKDDDRKAIDEFVQEASEGTNSPQSAGAS